MTVIIGNEPDELVLWAGPGGAVQETNEPDELVWPYPTLCPDPPAPEEKDLVPPEVAFVSPAPGTTLLPTDQIVFDVTDNLDELGRAWVALANNATGDVELLHDGSSFTPRYAALSSRVAIVDGFRFTVRRTGGWPSGSTITVRVFAVDQDGNLEVEA